MKIEEQIHLIKPKNWWKLETIKLWELFKSYNTPWIKQIIRFNEKVYKVLLWKIQENNINLFNKIDPNTNSKLIQKFNSNLNKEYNNKWLIIKIEPEIISWQVLPILIENSLQVVKILEMNDLFIEDIKKQELYKNWINESKNFKEFKKWFIEEFEEWRITKKEFDSYLQLFYRKISLLKN